MCEHEGQPCPGRSCRCECMTCMFGGTDYREPAGRPTKRHRNGTACLSPDDCQEAPCIHPGVFARPDMPYQHCYRCDQDIPNSEL